MKKILNIIVVLLMLFAIMGCSATMAKEDINKETLRLDTKWMGTYRDTESFPSAEIQITRYEDGSGEYIRRINGNGEDKVLEGVFNKITDNKVKDEVNDVIIVFSDNDLMFVNLLEEEVEFFYEKISPLIEADFELSNGVYKGMDYQDLNKVITIQEQGELSVGAMNTATVEEDGLQITLQSNTELIEDSSVFAYRVKSKDIKTFRGIGIGDSVEEVFLLYGEKELFGKSSFVKYEVGQYTLVFDIYDKKVREILCVNNIIM